MLYSCRKCLVGAILRADLEQDHVLHQISLLIHAKVSVFQLLVAFIVNTIFTASISRSIITFPITKLAMDAHAETTPTIAKMIPASGFVWLTSGCVDAMAAENATTNVITIRDERNRPINFSRGSNAIRGSLSEGG